MDDLTVDDGCAESRSAEITAPLRRDEAVHGIEAAVEGAVQGVGFRPFVARTARTLGLAGRVRNGARGVVVEAWGERAALLTLVRRIADDAPPAARIRSVETRWLSGEPPRGRVFSIAPSSVAHDAARAMGPGRTAGSEPSLSIGPDLAVCPECEAEVLDPLARRHRYPFTNCTQCGPRYTIATGAPYDRERTTMSGFSTCDACRAEYEDPADRRFHAQPIACPECGPQLELFGPGGVPIGTAGEAALTQAAAALRAGEIVAVLGLGGFHLMVRADREAAVARLRARKRRGDKPFAVMVRSLAAARACFVGGGPLGSVEEAALRSPEAPIVLIRRPAEASAVARAVAPGCADLGLMLPPTPLHLLLAEEVGVPLVATSGNRSEEPMATTLDQAVAALEGVADLFLSHDRPIARAVDDSLVRVVEDELVVLRRARGFAPLALDLPPAAAEQDGPAVLAVGAHQKATVGLDHGGRALLSPHIGDLGSSESRDLHRTVTEDLCGLASARPGRVVCDQHRDYGSTLFAEELADAPGGPELVRVQHHCAHASAALAECSPGAVDAVAIVWDGSGAGADGTIWGGETFRRTPDGWGRVATFEPFPLPGGERAAREPWRVAVGLCAHAFGGNVPAALEEAISAAAERAGHGQHLATVRSLASSALSPRTSSVGRLFDAVAALVGLCDVQSFEADAAMRLERAASSAPVAVEPYPLRLELGTQPGRSTPAQVEHRAWLEALAADLARGAPCATIAARFHAGLAALTPSLAALAGEGPVLLTGGCFQNRLLLERSADALRAAGRCPDWPRAVPVNDGGIAFGQLAHERLFPSPATPVPPSPTAPCASPFPARSSK